MMDERAKLPVFNTRETILQMIRDNPVIIIRGETGCGKTTQVIPPFCDGGPKIFLFVLKLCYTWFCFIIVLCQNLFGFPLNGFVGTHQIIDQIYYNEVVAPGESYDAFGSTQA